LIRPYPNTSASDNSPNWPATSNTGNIKLKKPHVRISNDDDENSGKWASTYPDFPNALAFSSVVVLRCALLGGFTVLALSGCYTQVNPPGLERPTDRPPQISRDLQPEDAYTVYLYHFDVRRSYDPFRLHRSWRYDPWDLRSSYHSSYRNSVDPFYSPYLHSVRNSWRWYGGQVIWSPLGVFVDSRWRSQPDPLPLPPSRPRIRRSGFEGPPASASDVRQTVPTTTYTPPSTPSPPPSSPPQEAPKQTQKKEEEKSKEEKREEKRKDQRRREGMR
jgi:hypothetical protein